MLATLEKPTTTNDEALDDDAIDSAFDTTSVDDGADKEKVEIAFERRRHPRIPIRQFGKIYDWRTRKYIPCVTCNVSVGGAFIEIARPQQITRGDRLLIGLSASDKPAIIRTSDLFEVEVMRAVTTPDGRQGLALRFLNAATESEPTQLRLAA